MQPPDGANLAQDRAGVARRLEGVDPAPMGEAGEDLGELAGVGADVDDDPLLRDDLGQIGPQLGVVAAEDRLVQMREIGGALSQGQSHTGDQETAPPH